jgi:hypothetical protein
VSAVFHIPVEQLLDRKGKEAVDFRWGITRRSMMQKTGQTFRNVFGEDVLLTSLSHRAPKDVHTIVVSDVRYDNEAEMVQMNDGVVIRVERDYKDISDAASLHLSERGVMHHLVTMTIDNNGSLDDLESAVKKIIIGWNNA